MRHLCASSSSAIADERFEELRRARRATSGQVPEQGNVFSHAHLSYSHALRAPPCLSTAPTSLESVPCQPGQGSVTQCERGRAGQPCIISRPGPSTSVRACQTADGGGP